jgi:hypothetical protein
MKPLDTERQAALIAWFDAHHYAHTGETYEQYLERLFCEAVRRNLCDMLRAVVTLKEADAA